MAAPDPEDSALADAFGHRAFYTYGEPYRDNVEDTGLRCWCGREVVSCDDTESRWAHVGVGASDDLRMEVAKWLA